MKNKINKIINCIVIMVLVVTCLTLRNQVISLKQKNQSLTNELNLTKNKLNLGSTPTMGGTKVITKIVYRNIVTQQSINDKKDLNYYMNLTDKFYTQSIRITGDNGFGPHPNGMYEDEINGLKQIADIKTNKKQ
jgi:hypothetical protein